MKNKKLVWTIILMVIFSIIGMLNIVNIDISDFGSWRHYFGIGFLLLALIEFIVMLKILMPKKSTVRISDGN
jgi:hypothetical protein